ncbi:DnaB-like helicase N-terminal domain-containing protein [Kitasatospora aureofaciens]|uniref:DnaB-like helicase N-terminal domain-containing protein n=1 Tax=Kitasatospora aureofaciens TaxID=1894 RepID=UPI0033F42186
MNQRTPDAPLRAPAPRTSLPVEGSVYDWPEDWAPSPSEPEPALDFTPPYDLEAEMAVLAACLFSTDAVAAARRVLDPADFYRPAHEAIWRTMLALVDAEAPSTDIIVVRDALEKAGRLRQVGGADYLFKLGSVPYSVTAVDHYAHIVAERSRLRELHNLGTRLTQQAASNGADPELIRADLDTALAKATERATSKGGTRLDRHTFDGWAFITNEGKEAKPLWGSRENTAWATGESLMLVGAPGVGKTTIAQQLVLARIGLLHSVLDMPVAPGQRVLYLAMDRPAQIARAFRRMIHPADQNILTERLVFRQGPLDAMLNKDPGQLAELAAHHRADTVVIDSLKDAVGNLVDDEAALAYHNARQRLARDKIELIELHHQRKATADAPRGQRPTLDRVYGSAWYTAGAGSVIYLAGDAGDPVVQLHHLKTATGEVGPLTVIHDHQRGTSRVDVGTSPLSVLKSRPDGVTAKDLATIMRGDQSPTRADVERARRVLDQLATSGHALKEEGSVGGPGGGRQARYRPSSGAPRA